MYNIKRPTNITQNDWDLLLKKYPNNIQEIINKIDNNYPIQYLIGHVNFYGYQINVDESVLIPRFETEYLVEKTIYLIKKYNFLNPSILDLATGSGCIAIALKKEISSANLTAIDNSKKALKKALENIKINNTDIQLINLDILKDDFKGKYDIIISNPPYVNKKQEVDIKTKYEPQEAIFAANEGTIFFEEIAKKSQKVLKEKSIIALEIGYDQKDIIINIFKKYYPNAIIYSQKDYNDFDRYIFILNNCE